MKLTKQQLEEKGWYRLLKVIFIIAVIAVILNGVYDIYSKRPYRVPDRWKVYCKNEQTFVSNSDNLGENDKRICGSKSGLIRVQKIDKMEVVHYRFKFEAFGQGLLWVIIGIIILFVIKKIVLYIIYGKKQDSKTE